MNIRHTPNNTQFAIDSGGVIEVQTGRDDADVAMVVCGSHRTAFCGISVVTMDIEELAHLGARMLAIAARLGHEHEHECNHNQFSVVKGS